MARTNDPPEEELRKLLSGPRITEKTLEARIRTYYTLRTMRNSVEQSLKGAKQLLHTR